MLHIDETLCSHLQTEIRKLKPAELYNIALLLNVEDDWKKLMSVVPKENNSSILKFNNDHIVTIEQGAKVQHRNCAEIFLDEWSTMGRKRPTVETLLNLLIKAGLYRVADYININILKRGETERPKDGPAARIGHLSAIFTDNEFEFDHEHNFFQSNVLDKYVQDLTIKDKILNSPKISKSDEYSEEHLELDNKSTQIFDDFERKHLSTARSNSNTFEEDCDKDVSESPVKFEQGEESANNATTTPPLHINQPKIPIFLQDSFDMSCDNNNQEKIYNDDISQMEKNLSSLNSNQQNQSNKETNIPKFLTLSSFD